MNRTCTTLLAGALIVAACTKTDTSTQSTQTKEMPMLAAPAVDIALVSNYNFMSAMISKGDGKNFGLFYVDTATLHRAGYDPIHGQPAITDFIRNADEWGVQDLTRISDGFRLEGRDVIDSGTYTLASYQPLPAKTIDPKGRYRTHWTYTPKAEWLILSDSLIGVKK